MFAGNLEPVELGKSKFIRSTEGAYVNELIQTVTLSFSKDGQKLIFIDNQVWKWGVIAKN
jgi:hypothetical protein